MNKLIDFKVKKPLVGDVVNFINELYNVESCMSELSVINNVLIVDDNMLDEISCRGNALYWQRCIYVDEIVDFNEIVDVDDVDEVDLRNKSNLKCESYKVFNKKTLKIGDIISFDHLEIDLSGETQKQNIVNIPYFELHNSYSITLLDDFYNVITWIKIGEL